MTFVRREQKVTLASEEGLDHQPDGFAVSDLRDLLAVLEAAGASDDDSVDVVLEEGRTARLVWEGTG